MNWSSLTRLATRRGGPVLLGAAALGTGYVITTGAGRVLGAGQDAGARGNNGLYSLDSGPQTGNGYDITNLAYTSKYPVQALKNTGSDAVYRMSGGRFRPGTEPFDPSVRGLAIDDLNIGATVRTGGFDPEFEDPANMPGQVIGGTLTNDERAMIQLMDPKDRARYLLQKRIQEKAEMAVLLSQLQSLRHQTAMSVINNIR